MTPLSALFKGAPWVAALHFWIAFPFFVIALVSTMFLPAMGFALAFALALSLQPLLGGRFSFTLPRVRQLVRQVLFGGAGLGALLALLGSYRDLGVGTPAFVARVLIANVSLTFAIVLFGTWFMVLKPKWSGLGSLPHQLWLSVGLYSSNHWVTEEAVRLRVSQLAPLFVLVAVVLGVFIWRKTDSNELQRSVSGTRSPFDRRIGAEGAKTKSLGRAPQPALLEKLAASSGWKKWLLSELFLARSLRSPLTALIIPALLLFLTTAAWLRWSSPAHFGDGAAKMALVFALVSVMISIGLAGLVQSALSRWRSPVSRRHAFRQAIAIALVRAGLAFTLSFLLVGLGALLGAKLSQGPAAPWGPMSLSRALLGTWPLWFIPFAVVLGMRLVNQRAGVLVLVLVPGLAIPFLIISGATLSVPRWLGVLCLGVCAASIGWARYRCMNRDLV
ncbi:MAG: hypothetical protein SFV15_24055 [Polyangiaceae bacterium]|nr:hypothetical protein [Polyangiaceae bacterium]